MSGCGAGRGDSELSLLWREEEAEDSDVPSTPFSFPASFTITRPFFFPFPSFDPFDFFVSDCWSFFCCLCVTWKVKSQI
jgi:hypothetical protein